MKPGLALQFAPQDQLMVVLGLQYAVDAKNEYGLKAEICAWERAAIDCLFTAGLAVMRSGRRSRAPKLHAIASFLASSEGTTRSGSLHDVPVGLYIAVKE